MKTKTVVYQTHDDVGDAILIKHFQTWVAERYPGWTVEGFDIEDLPDKGSKLVARLVKDGE